MSGVGEGLAGDGWCILRTSGRHTMRLAETLSEDGFDVWTPIETKTVRVPKSNVKRQVRQPIMPSYIFARLSHLIELLQLAGMPVKPRRGVGWGRPGHVSFSVMKRDSGVISIADRHLGGLRSLEAKRQVRPVAEVSFEVGAGVRVTDKGGSFAGMLGKVQRSDPTITLLLFGNIPVKVPTCVLSLDGVPAPLSGGSK